MGEIDNGHTSPAQLSENLVLPQRCISKRFQEHDRGPRRLVSLGGGLIGLGSVDEDRQLRTALHARMLVAPFSQDSA